MRTEKGGTMPDYRYFYFNPWRYCSNCGTCHKDMMNCYKRAIGNWKREIGEDRDGLADETPDRRYEPDGRTGKNSRREEDGRPADDGGGAAVIGSLEDENRYSEDKPHPEVRPYGQTHVHEYTGSTKLDEFDEDVHNHRVAGITGEAIRTPSNHIHKVWTRTDFFDHFHYIEQFTGPAVYVEKRGDADSNEDYPGISEEPHIHFTKGLTSINDGHNHEFQFATLIDSPLLPEPEVV